MFPHTSGMCCPFRPAQIPEQGVSPTQPAVCALWGHALPRHQRAGGWRLVPAATPQNPTPEARLPRQRGEATPLWPPPPPHASCLRPCWNVTGVVARACPNSGNTRFSPQGFPQPPALVRWMAEAGLLMSGRPPEVAASTGPCGSCCPHAAAQLITGRGEVGTPRTWRGPHRPLIPATSLQMRDKLIQ